MEARFRRIFIRIIATLPGFFLIFQRKTSKFFDINTYFQSQISAYLRYVFFLQADGFLCNGSSIPSHFYANNFFHFFFKQFKGKAPIKVIFRLEKACSGSKRNESRLKLDIFNPKMLHNCPHALGDNSNTIDGHRWAAMDHRWLIDGIEWSLSTGVTQTHYQT